MKNYPRVTIRSLPSLFGGLEAEVLIDGKHLLFLHKAQDASDAHWYSNGLDPQEEGVLVLLDRYPWFDTVDWDSDWARTVRERDSVIRGAIRRAYNRHTYDLDTI